MSGLFSRPPEVAKITVPDLVGKTLAQAKAEAGETELDVLGEGEQIIEQFPEAGETMNMDSKIVVYLG